MLALLMVACAVAASLALGVLVAYGIAMSMFRVFRMQSMAAARRREALQPAEVRA